jgi:hypothetical protein
LDIYLLILAYVCGDAKDGHGILREKPFEIRGGATCTPGGAGEPPQILNLYPIIVMFLQMNPLKF